MATTMELKGEQIAHVEEKSKDDGSDIFVVDRAKEKTFAQN